MLAFVLLYVVESSWYMLSSARPLISAYSEVQALANTTPERWLAPQ